MGKSGGRKIRSKDKRQDRNSFREGRHQIGNWFLEARSRSSLDKRGKTTKCECEKGGPGGGVEYKTLPAALSTSTIVDGGEGGKGPPRGGQNCGLGKENYNNAKKEICR